MGQDRRQPKSAAFLSRTFPSADRRNARNPPDPAQKTPELDEYLTKTALPA